MKNLITIEEYIDAFPKDVQVLLERVRRAIRTSAKQAKETISYGIPTFQINKKNLVHFAAFKQHIGFYPTPSAIIAFKKELAPYKQSKGAVQFPIDQPIPIAVIKKIVLFRVKALLKASI